MMNPFQKHFLIGLIALTAFSCSQPEETDQAISFKEYSIDQFYKNEKVYGGVFSGDEKKLLVSSNESGIFNLYEIDIETTKKTPLTTSTQESYYAIDYIPGTNNVLFSADNGGNEISHLYRWDTDGKITDLSPEENAKSEFYGWDNNKTHFYYVSNKRDEKYFDLYKMDITHWESSLLYKNTKGFNLSGISWDEKYVSLIESITTSESKMYIEDIKNGNTKEISSPKTKGSYAHQGFSKDGQWCYYTSDDQGEFQTLNRYNLNNGAKELVYKADWNVSYSYTSENEKYRVIVLNEDGKNRPIIINNQTGKKVNFPEIKDGNVLGVSVSPSEEWMQLTVGSSKTPNDKYVYNFKSGDIKRLTNTLNPEINPNHLAEAEVVRYTSFDGLEIPAIYYKPLTANKNNKVPALVWVHGGPGGQSKVGYFSLIQYMVNHGYAVLAVNNRGSSGYGKTFYQLDDKNHGENDLQDCIYGKKWLQSRDYIDTNKIGIIGGSYGGYMTMAAMTFTPDEFKVGVNIFGVTNWIRTTRSIPAYWEAFKEALYAEIGDPYTKDSVRLKKISPLFHAQNVKNPIMVLQGANDPRVLQIESDEIVAEVKKNGVPVEYLVFPDEGHGFVKTENEIKAYGQIVQFLDQYLKNTPSQEAEK